MFPMTATDRCIETPTVLVELVAPLLIEQRYRQDAHFTPKAHERERSARWKLAGRGRYALLVVVPPGMAMHAPTMNEDVYRKDSVARRIIALAVVAGDTAMTAAMKYYFRYFAQSFEARVFGEEEEARSWLRGKIAGEG